MKQRLEKCVLSFVVLFMLLTPVVNAVVINEFQSSNGYVLADSDGDYQDWIELYNGNDYLVDLTGYHLSDDLTDLSRWEFPSGTEIPSKEYLLVFASGKDRSVGELHTNFRINREGEPLVLVDADGRIVDHSVPTNVLRNISFGRYPDGADNWVFFTDPTPGSPNTLDGAYSQITQPPIFSVARGFYTEPFYLALSNSNPDAKIYYTLDGSEPTIESLKYERPVLISSESHKTDYISERDVRIDWEGYRIDTDHVAQNFQLAFEDWQPISVFQGTVVRAVAYVEGEQISDIATHTYFVGEEIASRYTLPVISINIDPVGLFDERSGIYVAGVNYVNQRPNRPWNNPANYTQRGREWEKEVHLEYFEPNGEIGFHMNMGLRIHGGASRAFPQKSLRLYARSDYDRQNIIQYPIFPGLTRAANDEPLELFKRLLLRNSGNDWTHTMFADALMQSIIEPFTLVDTQAYRPVIVFLNGEYWGIYNLRERYDKHYFATNYNFDHDDIVIMDRHGINTGRRQDERHYNEMLNFIRHNSMTSAENFSYVTTQMDIDNFIDYCVAQIYFGNNDWPQNNIKFWRLNIDEYSPDAPYGHDGRWRWLIYDTDFGFGFAHENQAYTHNTLAHAINRGELFRLLQNNETFKQQFVNRFADLLNTAFQTDRVIDTIDQMEADLEGEIQEHINRWGTLGQSVEAWKSYVETFRVFADRRPDYVKLHLDVHFKLGGTVELEIGVEEGGTVQINSIIIEDDHWVGTYFANIPVTLTAIPDPGYQFVEWVGSTESSDISIDIDLSPTTEVIAVFERI